MNFLEWFKLQEGIWLASVGQNGQPLLHSTGGRPFFYFDDIPVVEIDFRFELYGYNKLNSLQGARFLARIPDNILYADGNQYPVRAEGRYLVVNTVYRGPSNDPHVIITTQPNVAMKRQMEIEAQQQVGKLNPRIDPAQMRSQMVIPPDWDKQYETLPRNWLNYALIVVQRSANQPHSQDVMPISSRQTIDLYDMTKRKQSSAIA